MEEKEFIAYEGTYFTVEWFFDSNGKSQSRDYFYQMENSQKRKVLMLFKRIGDFGRISDKTKFRNELDGIYAFKPQPHRFLSFFAADRKNIITEGFLKKSRKIPLSIKRRSLRLRKVYLKRIHEGTYYE